MEHDALLPFLVHPLAKETRRDAKSTAKLLIGAGGRSKARRAPDRLIQSVLCWTTSPLDVSVLPGSCSLQGFRCGPTLTGVIGVVGSRGGQAYVEVIFTRRSTHLSFYYLVQSFRINEGPLFIVANPLDQFHKYQAKFQEYWVVEIFYTATPNTRSACDGA